MTARTVVQASPTSALQTADVEMWGVIAGLVLAVVIIAGTMVIPIPRRLASLATPVAFWRRESVRQRLQQRRPLLVMYAALFAVAALVLVLWVLPSLLTKHPHIPKSADRHQAISNARTGLALMLTALGGEVTPPVRRTPRSVSPGS
jgi:hypothetical protein